MSSKTVGEGHARAESEGAVVSNSTRASIPSIVAPEEPSRETSPKSTPILMSASTPTLPAPVLHDRANTLQIDGNDDRRSSFGRLRGKSPARKMRDIFSKSGKSPRSSPERGSNKSVRTTISPSRGESPLGTRRQQSNGPDHSPSRSGLEARGRTDRVSTIDRLPQHIQTDLVPPRTPPDATITAPMTTVTPPTPVEKQKEFSAEVDGADKSRENPGSPATAPSSAIVHRRVKSASSLGHNKSKLSTSSIPPLTPMIEEVNSPTDSPQGTRNVTPGGGFFSSWVSAAQNAASTLSNLTGQNKPNRSSTTVSESGRAKAPADAEQASVRSVENNSIGQKLAIETLGSGDLNFGHLGLDSASDEMTPASARPALGSMRQDSDLNRVEAHAKVEDMLAKRAVSAAYEVSDDATPIAEVQDPFGSLKHASTVDVGSVAGTSTPPNGSVFDGDGGLVKRSNSVRSKIAQRRSRGSSIATGQSTIASLVPSTAATLVNPAGAAAPKATGFTPAPKARNRAFHQQFRSVPEDDNLVEDYSCALQKEILLAGRLYISEGHICFSSNILGWVTTLIISFEEIVSIEKENTAMIIPNAIAVQTLHARHTFRSLLSREAAFDLIIGIWKVNHPASFQKSVNGKQLVAEQAQNVTADALAPGDNGSLGSGEDDGEGSDSADDDDDDDDDDAASEQSELGESVSIAGSEFLDAKSVARKPSGTNGISSATGTTNGATASDPTGTGATTTTGTAGLANAAIDFPGPATHAATDCSDAATHYEKVIKDEVIAAPLGKVYSLLYGPESGIFVRKYLVDECKCTDLALDDDKKGLNKDIKERQYSYIKPLNAPIGPKSTKCITTEALNFFDLEQSVSVTCTTQTPDVPSGSAFSTKTRYCLSWAPGNATRLQMNCTIEWTAKSWLKGAIERGANDGQQQYGDGLVKALKAALGRSRATTGGSKSGPKSRRKRRTEKKVRSAKTSDAPVTTASWGLFEPLHSTLGPVVDIAAPVLNMESVVTILFVMVVLMWFRGSGRSSGIGHAGALSATDRLAVYEELWSREESQLWDWLEARAGIQQAQFTGQDPAQTSYRNGDKEKAALRQKHLAGKDLAARMRAEKWSHKEVQEAVRVTRQRLDDMQNILNRQTR